MSRSPVPVVDVAGHEQLRDMLFLQLVSATPHLRGSGAEKWALYDTLPVDGEWYDARVLDGVARGAVRSLDDDRVVFAALTEEFESLHRRSPSKHDAATRRVCNYLAFCLETLADAIERSVEEAGESGERDAA